MLSFQKHRIFAPIQVRLSVFIAIMANSCIVFLLCSVYPFSQTGHLDGTDRAGHSPLLPALVPARSMACSMFSVVRTPKRTGLPFLARPWQCLWKPHYAHRQWLVEPRITAQGESQHRTFRFCHFERQPVGFQKHPEPMQHEHQRPCTSCGAGRPLLPLRSLDIKFIESGSYDTDLDILRNQLAFKCFHF